MLSSTAVEIAFVVERVHVSSTVEAVDEAMSGMVVLWVCVSVKVATARLSGTRVCPPPPTGTARTRTCSRRPTTSRPARACQGCRRRWHRRWRRDLSRAPFVHRGRCLGYGKHKCNNRYTVYSYTSITMSDANYDRFDLSRDSSLVCTLRMDYIVSLSPWEVGVSPSPVPMAGN